MELGPERTSSSDASRQMPCPGTSKMHSSTRRFDFDPTSSPATSTVLTVNAASEVIVYDFGNLDFV